jgi:hypothetical protein
MSVKHVLAPLQGHIRFKLPHSKPQLWFIPIVLVMIVSSLLLLVIFQLPYAQVYPVEAWLHHATGVHGLERVNQLEYAYTNGDAEVTFPEVGSGRFLAALQLGGPTKPVSAHLGTDRQQVDLGMVENLRSYHLLLPTTSQGNLQMRLTSGVQFLEPDPRPLGALVGGITVQAVGAALPAPIHLMTTLLGLGLFWLAITQFPATVYWKASLLLLIGVVCAGSYALSRGVFALQPWWIGLGAAAVVSMIVWRIESWEGVLSWQGILLICIVWRVALWLVALAGLWQSDAIGRQWRGFSFSFGMACHDRCLDELGRRALPGNRRERLYVSGR